MGRRPLVIGKFNPGVGEWRGPGEVEERPFQGRVVDVTALRGAEAPLCYRDSYKKAAEVGIGYTLE